RLRPLPVHATIDFLDEIANLDFLRLRTVEVRLAEKRSGEEQRGVDGRQLGVAESVTGLHVEEVIEEAFVSDGPAHARVLRRIVKKAQRPENPLPRLFTLDVPALGADGISRQAESHGRNARERLGRITIGNEPVFAICRVPEKTKCTL